MLLSNSRSFKTVLVRIRYYLTLLTNLWCAPADVPGYEEKRHGFQTAIRDGMNQAIRGYPKVQSTLRNAGQ